MRIALRTQQNIEQRKANNLQQLIWRQPGKRQLVPVVNIKTAWNNLSPDLLVQRIHEHSGWFCALLVSSTSFLEQLQAFHTLRYGYGGIWRKQFQQAFQAVFTMAARCVISNMGRFVHSTRSTNLANLQILVPQNDMYIEPFQSNMFLKLFQFFFQNGRQSADLITLCPLVCRFITTLLIKCYILPHI